MASESESESKFITLFLYLFPFINKKHARVWIGGILVTTLISFIFLILLLFSCSVAPNIYLLGRDITHDNDKVKLIMGTLGYCLEVSNVKTCSKPPTVLYKIDPNHVKILSQFEDASYVMKMLSGFNSVGFIGATGAFIFGFIPVMIFRKVAVLLAFIGFVGMLGAFAFPVDYKRRALPKGIHLNINLIVYLTIIPVVALFGFTCIMIKLIREKEKKEKEKEKETGQAQVKGEINMNRMQGPQKPRTNPLDSEFDFLDYKAEHYIPEQPPTK